MLESFLTNCRHNIGVHTGSFKSHGKGVPYERRHSHILAIWVCAAVKGMVFRQLWDLRTSEASSSV